MKTRWKLLAGFLCGCMVVGIVGWAFSVPIAPSFSKPLVSDKATLAAKGAAEFEGASFGGLSMSALESHALPWRLAAAALVLSEVENNPATDTSQKTLNAVLSQFGFLMNAVPGNRAPGSEAPLSSLPLGMTNAFISPIGGTKLHVNNLGCAACHAGVTYDENGIARPDKPWLGMPNTSLNLEAYVLAVFKAMRKHVREPAKLIETAQQIFPEMNWREAATLRRLVLPLVADRLETLADTNRPLPFPNGVPGATNGVAALKHTFGISLINDGPGDNGIVSVPDLGNRVWRSSLLADGAYAPPQDERQRSMHLEDVDDDHLNALANITTFFTVPSMGVHPDQATSYREEARAIFQFLADEYKPQAFPGSINMVLARTGFSIYQRECSQCHGTYEWRRENPSLTKFPNWLGTVGTDTLRASAFTKELADAIAQTTYSDTIAARSTGQYVAPPLTGIWASAPYLHNGSVPSIEALLSTDKRPKRFMLGGHALDFNSLGIKLDENGQYPSSYDPFSMPVLYDTDVSGLGNEGHYFGGMLEDNEKRNLIEFLKLL